MYEKANFNVRIYYHQTSAFYARKTISERHEQISIDTHVTIVASVKLLECC
jgi:hypothetical protein